MTDEYLELTADEVLTLFTSTSEFVWQLQNFTDSDLFFTLNPILQEVMLQALDRHTALYEKITMYLEKHGIPAMKIFEYDTKIMKPKGGI
jgi:hypothetical protein